MLGGKWEAGMASEQEGEDQMCLEKRLTTMRTTAWDEGDQAGAGSHHAGDVSDLSCEQFEAFSTEEVNTPWPHPLLSFQRPDGCPCPITMASGGRMPLLSKDQCTHPRLVITVKGPRP